MGLGQSDDTIHIFRFPDLSERLGKLGIVYRVTLFVSRANPREEASREVFVCPCNCSRVVTTFGTTGFRPTGKRWVGWVCWPLRNS